MLMYLLEVTRGYRANLMHSHSLCIWAKLAEFDGTASDTTAPSMIAMQ